MTNRVLVIFRMKVATQHSKDYFHRAKSLISLQAVPVTADVLFAPLVECSHLTTSITQPSRVSPTRFAPPTNG